MPLELSRLRPADAAVLGPLHNRIWRETYSGLLPEEVLAARDDTDNAHRWQARALAHEVNGVSAEGCTTWVARDDAGVPIGWIGVGPARDTDAPAPVEVWALYVAPEHQGAGVARALVDAFLPAGPAFLWVLRGNDRAVAFYRKVGFETDGASRFFGDTGAVELRMSRP